jgi:hypothetical protein
MELLKRMKPRERSRLEIVLVLANVGNVFLEKASIEVMQANVIGHWLPRRKGSGRYSAKYFMKCIAGTAERREIALIA